MNMLSWREQFRILCAWTIWDTRDPAWLNIFSWAFKAGLAASIYYGLWLPALAIITLGIIARTYHHNQYKGKHRRT